MFERYTEEARRIVFFARYEAACVASPFITPDHLLLGIIRQCKPVLTGLLNSPESLADIQRQVAARSPDPPAKPQAPITVDLPLDRDARAVLASAAGEADSLHCKFIEPAHLLLAILRHPDTAAARLLASHGAAYDTVRRQLALDAPPPAGLPATTAPSLSAAADRFEHLLAFAARQLPEVDPILSATPLKPAGWSRRQVLGHLVDSASNNHQRLVRALISTELNWPNYEQEAWVKAQAYQDADWEQLVALWSAYNAHLLWIVRHVPEQKLATVCRIGENPPLTLGKLINGYLDHLQHHLHQILG